ncbi:type II toxin-antitoxin system PemK/MazF family toxin [Streptomyces zaomyceticus]
MDTSWWPALVAVVVIGLVVALADGWRRSSRRPSGRTRPPTRPPGRPTGLRKAPSRLPHAAEIWWADVPFEDGPGSKDRPCLVLSVRGDNALVAKITSKYHDERPGVIALPPGAVGDAQGRPSFLETDELREVPVSDFRRKVGMADPVLWDRVRHLAR